MHLTVLLMKQKEKDKKKDNQYKLKKAMAIAIGLILKIAFLNAGLIIHGFARDPTSLVRDNIHVNLKLLK